MRSANHGSKWSECSSCRVHGVENGILYAFEFQEAGPIDVVRVVCTESTNFNCGYSYVLVNGSPAHVAIGIRRFDEVRAALDDDPNYRALVDSSDTDFTTTWDGEDRYVGSKEGPDGEQIM